MHASKKIITGPTSSLEDASHSTPRDNGTKIEKLYFCGVNCKDNSPGKFCYFVKRPRTPSPSRPNSRSCSKTLRWKVQGRIAYRYVRLHPRRSSSSPAVQTIFLSIIPPSVPCANSKYQRALIPIRETLSYLSPSTLTSQLH